MIIDSTGNNKITIGETQEYKTTIDIENLDFIATLLSSNLYSNPEASFIREIVSNGWDSQVEANNTESPLIVRIKYNNNYSYNITIRDYGTGLSKEDFERIYCKIGTSTKRNSNDFLGCFGIGKFATMAVSKVAYITSYYNGIARLYIMTKDGNSITTNLVSETPTDEHNGLEVVVKEVDKYKYENAFKNLAFFPNVYIDGALSEYNNIRVKRFKNFTAASTYYSDKLLLGNVLYPLNRDIIPVEYLHFYDCIVDSGIVFNFNIGELQVTPNRESIIYNSKTNALIVQRIKDTYEEIKAILKPIYEKDYTNPYDFYSVLKGYIYYNFIEGKFLEWNYSSSVYPRFKVNTFDFDITLKGKSISESQANTINYIRNYVPKLKAIVLDKVYSTDSNWRLRRYVSNKTEFITVKQDLKLTKYLKDYLLTHYNNKVLLSEHTFQDYLDAYSNNNTWKSNLTDIEKFIFEVCYEDLVRRSTFVDFANDPDFIKFKDKAKAEAKLNKVPVSIGKVILTVYDGSKDFCNSYKKEFDSYDKALKFIKSLKGGTLYRNLDSLNYAFEIQRLGYNVIAANKKTLELLAKENLTSRIDDSIIYKNKNLLILKAFKESGLDNGCYDRKFNASLSPRLQKLYDEAIRIRNRINSYGTICLLEKVEVDETLLKDFSEIKKCYDVYSGLRYSLLEFENLSSKCASDFLCYIILKNKNYRISYDCYKSVKNNKLLSMICKK